MNRSSHYISSGERYILLGFTGLLVIIVLFNIGSEALQNYNYWSLKEQTRLSGRQGTMIDFGPPGYYTPGLHLFSVVVFLATVLARKYIVAMLATVAYIVLIFVSLHARYQTFDSDSARNASLCQAVWLSAYPIDYLALIFLISLAIWYTSIFWRFRGKGQQQLLP
jgi:hypothetical protein